MRNYSANDEYSPTTSYSTISSLPKHVKRGKGGRLVPALWFSMIYSRTQLPWLSSPRQKDKPSKTPPANSWLNLYTDLSRPPIGLRVRAVRMEQQPWVSMSLVRPFVLWVRRDMLMPWKRGWDDLSMRDPVSLNRIPAIPRQTHHLATIVKRGGRIRQRHSVLDRIWVRSETRLSCPHLQISHEMKSGGKGLDPLNTVETSWPSSNDIIWRALSNKQTQ